MRRLSAYLPSVVLLSWSMFAAFGGENWLPVWLLLMAVATAVMVRELRERYRHD